VHPNYYGRTAAEKLTLDDLNTKIEELGAPVFRKLIDNPRAFTQEDWVTISHVLANLAVRTPVMIDEMGRSLLDMADQVNAHAEKMKEKLLEALEGGSDLSEFDIALPDDEAPSMTLDQMNQDAAKMRAEGGHRLAAHVTFAALPGVAKYIQQMRFLVLKAPAGHHFISSDHPLVLRNRMTGSPVGAGWANSNVQATIPLHPSRYLFMYYADSPGIEQYEAPSRVVDELNFATILFANSEVYSLFEYPEADQWMKGLGKWDRSK
jgi:hypothetical protein